jgi:dGTPase
LHVASAARTVARGLGLNEDLAEAIGLAHDIGHAPFGHDGQEIINDIIKTHSDLKSIIPEFSHEINGLRVVDKIAKLDREPPGLNLTWEVRDGIVSHCGEDRRIYTLTPCKGNKILESIRFRKNAGLPTTIEGCVVRLVDKVVYVGRDLEDAIMTGVIKNEKVPQEIKSALGKNNGEMVGNFLEDMIQNSGGNRISLSKKKGMLLDKLIEFNYKHIYYSDQAKKDKDRARYTLTSLFDELLKILTSTNRFRKDGNLTKFISDTDVFKVFKQFVMEDMGKAYSRQDPDSLIVLDFIAGMTDNFARSSYIELFVPKSTV